jgi:precorrin-8X/cobalt-precorrin-8 methylmutase
LKTKLENILPADIEKRSFEIIESELETKIDEEIKPIVKRVIHATADFSFEKSLVFSDGAVKTALKSIRNGVDIISDTNMIKAGINKKRLEKFGVNVKCFMSDDDVAQYAKKNGTTRAQASMIKACMDGGKYIFAIGNAPTALVELYDLIKSKKACPVLIIGVPVGFVNVVQSKELIKTLDVPYIISDGRKGGSTVATAIVNALAIMASKLP